MLISSRQVPLTLDKISCPYKFFSSLQIVHNHSKVENLPDEVIAAFQAEDKGNNRGMVRASELRHLLQNWGEVLSPREVDNIFREANVKENSMIRYSDFVKITCAPVPDYY